MTALRCISFTDKGFALARRLAAALEGTAVRCGGDVTLAGWTAEGFEQAKALVFVGAAGIAVRACAPCLKSKDVDPAVVAVDECARFAVPLVSGHLGGANDLARQIAALCGAQAVITTATDANGVFAVDSWAVRQGCTVRPVGGIKTVSAKLLAGEQIRLRSDWPIKGSPPAGVLPVTDGPCDVHLTLAAPAEGEREPLRVIPKILLAGIGCRKGTPMADIEAAVLAALQRAGADPLAVKGAGTRSAGTLPGPRVGVYHLLPGGPGGPAGRFYRFRICAQNRRHRQRLRAQRRGGGGHTDLTKTGGKGSHRGIGPAALLAGLAVAI